MNLLRYLDIEYAKIKNSKFHHKNYYFYLDISINNSYSNNSFICLKQSKVKFLIMEEIDKVKLYLSDADIIDSIIKLEKNLYDILINSFFQLYRNNGDEFVFFIDGNTYKKMGLKFSDDDKKMYFNTQIETKADFSISFEDLVNLINLILAKEIFSMELFETPSFNRLNRQLAKYISLSNFYRRESIDKSKSYLEQINYNTKVQNIFSVYHNERQQRSIDTKFNNTEVFEKNFFGVKIT